MTRSREVPDASTTSQPPASGEVCEDSGTPASLSHLVSIGLPPQQQQPDYYKSDSLRSTDSDILSDDLSPAKHKAVAIDISRNKHFSQKLLPVQSPEFDNVMDQVRNLIRIAAME